MVRIDRGLDLSRTVTVTMVIYSGEISPAVSAASYTLTFAPNETQKSITIPIHDDDLFEDTRNYPLHFTAFSGGAYSDEFPYGTTTIRVLDDEPRPTLTVGNARVFEGDVGFTPVYLPLQLSGPLGTDIYVYGEPHGLTASADDFLPSNEANTAVIRAGQTTGQLPIYIVADQRPEPDEQFLVYLESDSSSRTALFGPPAVVTILNDDYPATATSKHRAAGH